MTHRPLRRTTPLVRRWLHQYNKLAANEADVIVVGLGAMGAATAFHLAGSGMRVLGFDHPSRRGGHPAGQAAFSALFGPDEIAASALFERAAKLWREVEMATHDHALLREKVGLLHLYSTTADGQRPRGSSPDAMLRRARRMGIVLEQVDEPELRRSYSALSPPHRTSGLLEPGGGFVRADAALTVLVGQARRRGASRIPEEVVSILAEADGVTVVTTQQTYRAAKAVVAAGAWTPALTGVGGTGLQLFTQEQHWFGVTQPDIFAPAGLPAFVWRNASGPLDQIEGFPLDQGCPWWPGPVVAQVKAAALIGIDDYADVDPHCPADRWDSSARFRRERLAGAVRSLRDRDWAGFYRRWLVTRDRNYIVDYVPGSQRVLVAFGGPEHRFHDSIAVAEHVAAVVTGTDEVRPVFALNRSGLADR